MKVSISLIRPNIKLTANGQVIGLVKVAAPRSVSMTISKVVEATLPAAELARITALEAKKNVDVYVSGEDILSHRAIAIVLGLAYMYDASNADHYYCFAGFSTNNVNEGESVIVQATGSMSLLNWSLEEGGYLMASNNGTLTTFLVDEVFKHVIAKATTADSILIINNNPIKIE